MQSAQPYRSCNPYLTHFHQTKANGTQRTEFQHTKEFKQVSDDVYKILGINDSVHFGPEMIVAMWVECTFYQTINLDKLSPWCAVSQIQINKKK